MFDLTNHCHFNIKLEAGVAQTVVLTSLLHQANQAHGWVSLIFILEVYKTHFTLLLSDPTPRGAASEHFLNPVFASFLFKWNAEGEANVAVEKGVRKCNISSFWESPACLPFPINQSCWMFTESLRPLLPIPIFQPLGSCQTWCQIWWIYTTGHPLSLLCPICGYRLVGVNFVFCIGFPLISSMLFYCKFYEPGQAV